MRKVLVTGANGFVGTALCGALSRQEIPFVAAVRTKTRNDQHEMGGINTGTDWSKALLGADTVVHLAARVHVMNDRSHDPLAAFRTTNVDATLNLARQAVDSGAKRFVFVSSVKVNGEVTTDRAPFSNRDAPAPQDAYAISKFEAESGLTALAERTGLEVVIVRPPLVYGPGVRANFLRLMQLARSGLPLPFGAFENRRSMVALDNLTDLLVTCALHPAAAGETFMVSDDNDLTIPALLHMLSRAMGKPSFLLPIPASLISGCAKAFGKSAFASRLLDSLQVDISYTRSRLGWSPIIGVEEAVNRTAAHYLAKRQVFI
jgi:UDP-glucose 4-epimerase